MSNERSTFTEMYANKSLSTKRNYHSQYNKLLQMVFPNKVLLIDCQEEIKDTPQAEIMIKIKRSAPNKNAQQALINIAIQVLRLADQPIDQLIEMRESNKKSIKEIVKNTNLSLQSSLPKYDELIEFMDSLYNVCDWTNYIINYLLIHKQVRNADLIFNIVHRKKDTIDTINNYIWITRNKCVYIRNKYKTADTYGQKIDTIIDPKFCTACSRVASLQKHKELNGVFIPTESQVGYYIQKATLKQLGEGNYMKIVVNHFRNNLDMIKQISNNRGTDINTILSNYDIENV
jgi:hypothetical protein